jgi:Uma2 family endonuclease
VLTAETGFVLKRNPDTLRAPDVCFVRKERWAAAKKFFEGAPDVVVEVLSASNRPKDIARNVRDYLGAGAQQVWLVDPDSKTIDVHTQADCRTLTAQDVLDGGQALPGFALDLAALFAP